MRGESGLIGRSSRCGTGKRPEKSNPVRVSAVLTALFREHYAGVEDLASGLIPNRLILFLESGYEARSGNTDRKCSHSSGSGKSQDFLPPWEALNEARPR